MQKIMLSVRDVSEALGIGLNQAYKLVRKDDFPMIKVGQQYLIPEDLFKEWIVKNAKDKREF